jgi:putative ABC transport system ATP-binding protein
LFRFYSREVIVPVRLTALKKKYVSPDGTVVPVIDIDQFDLADGEQVALVGSSGSGKTTLLHLIAGILTPDSGSVMFAPREKVGGVGGGGGGGGDVSGGVDLTQLSEARRDVFRGQNVGYIFQTHHLLPGFTALENVLLGMTFGGKKHDPEWARRLLTEVGLADRMDYKPSKLSVGQQQRVAIARALANRPMLVLADEPTGSLDSAAAQVALDLIRKLCTEVGASLLIVSHDPVITGQLPRAVVLAELNKAAVGHAGITSSGSPIVDAKPTGAG